MDYSEFIAAIIGAATGGAISWQTQEMAFKRQQKSQLRQQKKAKIELEIKERKLEAQKAFIILLKLNRFCTDLNLFKKTLNETINKVIDKGGNLAQNFVPILADPEKMNFSPEELVIIRDICATSTVQDLINLPYIVNSHIDTFAHLRKLKFDLSTIPAKGDIDKGGIANVAFARENILRSKIIIFEMESLILSSIPMIFNDSRLSFGTFKDTQEAFMKYFGRSEMVVTWDIERHHQS